MRNSGPPPAGPSARCPKGPAHRPRLRPHRDRPPRDPGSSPAHSPGRKWALREPWRHASGPCPPPSGGRDPSRSAAGHYTSRPGCCRRWLVAWRSPRGYPCPPGQSRTKTRPLTRPPNFAYEHSRQLNSCSVSMKYRHGWRVQGGGGELSSSDCQLAGLLPLLVCSSWVSVAISSSQ